MNVRSLVVGLAFSLLAVPALAALPCCCCGDGVARLRVVDEAGAPVPGAVARFPAGNGGALAGQALLTTDESGRFERDPDPGKTVCITARGRRAARCRIGDVEEVVLPRGIAITLVLPADLVRPSPPNHLAVRLTSPERDFQEDLDLAVACADRAGVPGDVMPAFRFEEGERELRLLLPAPGRITLVLQVEVDGGGGGPRLVTARRVGGPDAAITIDVEDAEGPQVFPVPVDPEALKRAARMR